MYICRKVAEMKHEEIAKRSYLISEDEPRADLTPCPLFRYPVEEI